MNQECTKPKNDLQRLQCTQSPNGFTGYSFQLIILEGSGRKFMVSEKHEIVNFFFNSGRFIPNNINNNQNKNKREIKIRIKEQRWQVSNKKRIHKKSKNHLL